MEQQRAGSEPLRSSRRRRDIAGNFTAPLLLIAFASGRCGEREAVSSRRPRLWEARGQARRAGAPRAQSTGFPQPPSILIRNEAYAGFRFRCYQTPVTRPAAI